MIAIAIVAVVATAVLLLTGSSATRGAAAAAGRATALVPPDVYGAAYVRSTIYHSPQSPGYTAWVGAWTMPDGSVMTAFNQATGPVDPDGRQLMPEAVLESDFGLTEQPGQGSKYALWDPHRDFWGLNQSVVYLRSTDDGLHWAVWRTDPFRALAPQAYTPQADFALSDGTLIRRVSGYDLRNDPSIPHEATLETLKFDPAHSSTKASWSRPMVVLHDPRICTYQISRIHQLSDNRLVALGGVVGYANGESGPCAANAYSDMLLEAASPAAAEQGQWTLGMPFTTRVIPDEWDAAELPNGNLLALFRTEVNGQPAREEAILRRVGSGWVMGQPHAPSNIPAMHPSGHPDLLATRQGVILSFSNTGVAYTSDGGVSWRPLHLAGRPAGFNFTTYYYPKAIQAADGTILVFSSAGWDIPYGAFNESIVMDRFRLAIGSASTGSTTATATTADATRAGASVTRDQASTAHVRHAAGHAAAREVAQRTPTPKVHKAAVRTATHPTSTPPATVTHTPAPAPAAPVRTTPATPVRTTPATPVHTTPATPVHTTPAAPVHTTPASPAHPTPAGSHSGSGSGSSSGGSKGNSGVSSGGG